MTDLDLPWLLAKRHGGAPAIADETTSLSFAELDERTGAVAAQLAERGFRAGDVLAQLMAEAEGVLEVAVVGRPDGILGEVPVAFVVPYPGAEPDPENLLEHCRARLTRVKVPVMINVVDAMPRNPVGKVDKPALRCRLG